jgi:hypothetical protein
MNTKQSTPKVVIKIVIGVILGALPIILAALVSHWVWPPPMAFVEANILSVSYDNNNFTNFIKPLEVPVSVTISGECKNLPRNCSARVCVVPEDPSRYYFQEGKVANGKWLLNHVGLGVNDPKQIGKYFSIQIIVANSEADKEIEAKTKGEFGGLAALPNGTVVCDRIQVVRAK